MLEQPDGEHGERQEEAVDQQAEAVEPVQLRLLLVDTQLWQEENSQNLTRFTAR